MLDIGAQIRSWRIAKGLTQGELAAAVGMKQSVISELETNTRKGVTTTTLDRIAGGLGITTAQLICHQPTEAAPAA